MPPSGFNPMRWDCSGDGCFNVKRRPKIEVFADCFPRRINFGDVDGLVELNGMFCLLEWKGDGGSLKRGQTLSFMAFTRHLGNFVLVVSGNAETMLVTGYSSFWRGKHYPARNSDLDDLKERVKQWAKWTESFKRQAQEVAA